MSKKIGRNDPCPCGSGKKYKHCCMLSEQSGNSSEGKTRQFLQPSSLNAPKTASFLSNHECTPILDYLIALQLNPENHGKNLRIEHLLQLAVSSLGRSHSEPDIDTFQKLVDEEYPIDVMEDLPINLFTEMVVFFGGNHVLFPGLSTFVTELFRAMTEAIFSQNNHFPDAFQRDVFQGVSILLELGDLIASFAGISGIKRGNSNPRETLSKPLTNHTYVISEKKMTEMIVYWGWDRKILEMFILDKDDPQILTDNADENPILYRPILHYNGNYYFIGITSQGCAINNFILKTAIKHDCLDYLVQQTQFGIWMRIGTSCIDYLHWQPGFADDLLNSGKQISEELFQIDVNWLAYVCYAKDTDSDVSIDGSDSYTHYDINSHIKTTLSALKKDKRTKGFQIFTLVLYSSMGERFMLSLNNQLDTNHLLLFSAFDFLQLVQTEKWDSMSLVRFARTMETKPFLHTGYNQALDIYSLYKHYDESFYFNDEASPSILQIEPNDGCHLIFESKEELNIHGTLFLSDGRYAYIPVQRDMDNAEIYKPLDPSLSAKSCESYSVPIWAKCLQKERPGINPTSIVNTIITAVVFWMNSLRPSIGALIEKRYKETVEIELHFSDEVLANRECQSRITAPKESGNLLVTKSETGVTVAMDYDFILSFMGPNNGAEREMMCKIIESLLEINRATALSIVDDRIPQGQAKMILMMEASNNPLSSPLWLYPPIYINSATIQLLLDLFPQWMIEKGHIIKKLDSKQEKVLFLHSGVDVLLEKLEERLSRFDTKSLLRMLLNNHETLIYRREHNKVLQPAQILCFGDTQEKRDEYYEEEVRLTDSGLATRALIEFVAATQSEKGTDHPGSDDIESLLSIMIEVIKIGGICDAIQLDVANHTIETLASGRYGIHDDDFNDTLVGFASARSVESVNEEIDDFERKMTRLGLLENNASSEKNEEHDRVDDAFKADWGVTHTNILQFLYCCHLVAVKKQTSVLEIAEEELKMEIEPLCTELSADVIKICLDRLSLDKRGDYLTPPIGMEKRDIYPWVYNRELSYLRRPIIRYKLSDGKVQCIYGFRSCLAAGLQLTDLLNSGRLRNGGKEIERILGKFEAKKGRVFNEEVRSYLQTIPGLTVWPHDVSMKPKGNLCVLGDDLGDIDVLAYDATRNILYSIECKNTNTAKNVKEMKTEMDEYLGRGDNPQKDQKKALVLKHLRRHQWLLNNSEQIMGLVGINMAPAIKSMMLTSSVIPTSYLKREESPLSILNYPELKLKGLHYLDSCKEPDLSVLN